MSQRIQITVEISILSGQNVKDAVQWVERSFNFFHPSLSAKVEHKSVVEVGAPMLSLIQSVADDLL